MASAIRANQICFGALEEAVISSKRHNQKRFKPLTELEEWIRHIPANEVGKMSGQEEQEQRSRIGELTHDSIWPALGSRKENGRNNG